MRTVGTFTIDPWTLLDDSSMKTELLYFDHLTYFIRGKEILERFCNAIPRGKESFNRRMKELDELQNAGLISEYSTKQFDNDYDFFKDEKTIAQAWARYKLAIDFKTNEKSYKEVFIDFLERFREVGQLESRTNAILLNKKYDDDNFVPIIKSSYKNYLEDEYFRKSNVLSVIIRNFPVAEKNLSIEKLVELKSDDDASIKLRRLKNWATEVSHSKLTEKEIAQKLEYLLTEYKRQLELHKLKYNLGVVESFVTISLEVLENIVKLNLSKAAKVFFDLSKKELTLLEAEEKLIGKELAYLQLLESN